MDTEVHEPQSQGATPETPEAVKNMACEVCMSRGTFALQPVEEVVRVGDNTAIVTIDAAICSVCGNRTYDPAAIEQVQAVRQALEHGDTTDLRPVGITYRAK